jgi:hypothetical protein
MSCLNEFVGAKKVLKNKQKKLIRSKEDRDTSQPESKVTTNCIFSIKRALK